MKKYFLLIICLLSVAITKAQFDDLTIEYGLDHTCINPSLMGGGAAFFDANNDGWIDLFVVGGESRDKLYLNQQGESYEEQARSIPRKRQGTLTSSVISGDINNDGCTDLFITTFDINHGNMLLINNCDGTFSDASEDYGLEETSSSMGATFIDYNKDGFLDLYVINYVKNFQTDTDEEGNFLGFSHECYEDFFYENIGGTSFEEKSGSLQVQGEGCGLAVTTLLDENGNEGIYIANDFGEWLTPNQFFVFNKDSNYFINEAPDMGLDIGLNGMGIGIGDYDGDLDFDLYVTNLGANYFMENEGFIYSNKAFDLGVENDSTDRNFLSTSWGTIFTDIDNDTDEDLIVANGWVETGIHFLADILDPNKVFLNDGGSFNDISETTGLDMTGLNRGVISGDIDNDGDQDLLFTYINFFDAGNNDISRKYRLFRNNTTSNNYLSINLVGVQSSTIPFGSTVKLFSGSNTYIRYLYSSGTHASQNSNIIHFGLGQLNNIDSLEVTWPTKITETIYNPEINQFIQIQEGTGVAEIMGCTNANDPYYNPLATVKSGCKLDNTTSVTSMEDNYGFELYPTISDGVIYIKSNESMSRVKAVLQDITGKVVETEQLEIGSGSTVPFYYNSSLPSGLYFLTLYFSNIPLFQGKVIKK